MARGAFFPKVSFLIVNWRGGLLTRECLEHISRYAGSIPREIIVVDNGVFAEEEQALAAACSEHGARLISLMETVSYGEANNIAAEAAEGEILILLNNDAFLREGCVEGLVSTLESAPLAGAVGPKFLYPGGRIQEAGAYVRPDGRTIQHGKHHAFNPLIGGSGHHVVDYCSAACLAIRRSDFLRMGGFDPMFDPAYFEDTDLALRLRSHNLFTYYLGDVSVVHIEGASRMEPGQPDTTENHRRFVGRWGDWLARRLSSEMPPPPMPSYVWRGDQPESGKPKIALRGRGLVQENAQWKRILKVAAELEQDYSVILLAEEICSWCRIMTIGGRLGIALRDFAVRPVRAFSATDTETYDLGIGAPLDARGRGPAFERVRALAAACETAGHS
jgi:GT2 family glycosyltransferase